MEIRVKKEINVPLEVLKIFELFKKEGCQLFLVGGAVRDSLLGDQPKDFDLVTNITPDNVIKLLKNESFVINILETGKSFGVINVITKNNEFEIATMRSDVFSDESDGRRPDSVVFGDIYSDSARRDLTINALFYDFETNEVIDLVGGINDLKNKIVRTVGKAEDRFKEDRLRILRCIRVAARFDSDLDEEIVESLQKNSSLLGISSERIRDEFLKGIKTAKSVRRFIKMLFDFNLMVEIFTSDLILNTRVGFTKDKIVVLAQLLKDNDITLLKGILNKLSFTTDEIKGVIFLIRLLNTEIEDVISLKKEQKLSGLSNEQIREFTRLMGQDGISVDLFLEFELTVSGTMVMEMTGMKAGPELGKKIVEMELEKFNALFS